MIWVWIVCSRAIEWRWNYGNPTVGSLKIRVVHLAPISLDENDVLWFWHSAPRGATIRDLHRGMRWSFLFSSIFVSHASTIHDLAGASNMVLTSLLSGESSALSPFYRGHCLHGRAFFATGLQTVCGVTTTLVLTVHCNTTIGP